ncbi:MAG: hypothetical protein M3Y80_02090 [Verrucomicrobiota bacterium]|nr:hypothetical protein [Verrucomicrobiota bacterium]
MHNLEFAGLLITSVGTACWVICFWWMHQISRRQDITLAELKRVTKRIERLAKEEHELIHELHPAVGEIRESMGGVAEAIGAQSAGKPKGGNRSAPGEKKRV